MNKKIILLILTLIIVAIFFISFIISTKTDKPQKKSLAEELGIHRSKAQNKKTGVIKKYDVFKKKKEEVNKPAQQEDALEFKYKREEQEEVLLM